MLVDLVTLRRFGRKRPREEVLAAEPVRGDLSIYLQRDLLHAALMPHKPSPDIPVLEEPRLTQMRGASFVVVGFEPGGQRDGKTRHPQAWWCRLAGGVPASPPAASLDLTPTREERRAARMAR